MYFVINGFITAICLIALLLFTNVFPKFIKILISLIASLSGAFAIYKLIGKIANMTNWFAYPPLIPTFLYVLAGTLVVAIIIALIISKRKKA